MAGASRIIAVDINPSKFAIGMFRYFVLRSIACAFIFFFLLLLLDCVAREFGATDCVNPKDHQNPIQQVRIFRFLLLLCAIDLSALIHLLELLFACFGFWLNHARCFSISFFLRRHLSGDRGDD
jgi:hypothetical protein